MAGREGLLREKKNPRGSGHGIVWKQIALGIKCQVIVGDLTMFMCDRELCGSQEILVCTGASQQRLGFSGDWT